MEKQQQQDKLIDYLTPLLGGKTAPWHLEQDGRPGFFLAAPGITLADAGHFLEEALAGADLLALPADSDGNTSFDMPLGGLTLEKLVLAQALDGEGYEVALDLVWPTDFKSTIGAFSDLEINFALQSIRASIEIYRPPSGYGAQRSSVLLTAVMLFNKVELDVTVQLPSLIVEAFLGQPNPDHTDTHQALLGSFLPTDTLPPHEGDGPQLTGLDVIVALRQKRVVLHFGAQNVFSLAPLTLKEVQADIIYDGGAGKPSGRLWTDIEIALGKGRSSIEMMLLAELEDGEWRFAGQTGPQGINVKDLLDGLGDLFPGSADLPAVPQVITKLKIASLGLTYDTRDHAFSFDCAVQFGSSPDEPEVTVRLHLDVTRQTDGNGHALMIKGVVEFSGYAFDLGFADKTGDEDSAALEAFVATYKTSQKLALRDLVGAITDADITAAVPPLTIDLQQVMFAYAKQGQQSAMLFGIGLDAKLSLDGLPLVGAALPSGVGVDGVQILYATGDVTTAQADMINGLLPTGQLPPPPSTTTTASTTGESPIALSHGFNFAAQLNLGAGSLPILANGGSSSSASAATADATTDATAVAAASNAADSAGAPSAPSTDNVMWYDVQRSLGPIALKRVGARYADQRLWLLLSADLNLSTFTIGLQGLGLGVKIGDWKNIAPTLNGLSLGYEAGPVEIDGAFQKSGDDYLGAATIKTGTYTLSAIGAYGESNGDTTLFIFAMLTDPPLGGPAFFYVTGLAVGFGYNRDVRIPTVDEMTQFPLVSTMMPEAKDAVSLTPDASDPMKTLEQISAGGWISKAPGQNWLAAGVRFTSFEMVQSFALLTVKFGTRFEVAILGLSQLTIPAPDPASGTQSPDRIAYAEVAFSARLIPDEGILRVDGKLTPASYILVKEARLTGGFAFYVWFDGDFVISFGGYHPHFDKGHYPDVPRLGIDFHIGSSLHITAKAYFALTPSAVMAGGQLDAVWDGGPLQAWFKAGADFLLMWKPFRYEVAIYVHIGASLTLDFAFFSISVTVELGADLTLWGPPLGGTASISYSIASFTIGFGADKPTPPALSWSEFRKQFLPIGKSDGLDEAQQNGALLSARVSAGLVKDLTQEKELTKAKDESPPFAWVVNQADVTIEVITSVPATAAALNDDPLPLPAAHYSESLHIGPMQQNGKNYTAPLVVTITYFNAEAADPENPWEPYCKVTAEIILGTSPKALWSDYDPIGQETPLSQAESSLNGTIVGIRLRPIATDPDETPAYQLKDLLFEEHEIERVAMFAAADAFSKQPLTDKVDLTTNIADNGKRSAIVQALQRAEMLDSALQVDLTRLANDPGNLIEKPSKRMFLI